MIKLCHSLFSVVKNFNYGMKKYTITLVAILVFIMDNSIAQTSENYYELAEKIHSEIVSIDTHVDTPLRMLRGFDITKRNDGRKDGSKLDFPRMKEGGLDAVFFAVFVGQSKRDAEGNRKAYDKAVQTFKVIDSVLAVNTNLAEIALTSADALKIKNHNKLAIYLGIENGYPIGKDISLVKHFYDMGARYITLCHTKNNDICDSSTDPEGPEHNGLSSFGKEVVKEMNRIGMIIDVSHVSDKTVLDILEISPVPVIASHSCAWTLNENPRNINDELIKKIAEKGGVIQVCFYSGYLKNPEPNPVRDSLIADLRLRYNDFEDLSNEMMQKARAERYEINEKFPQKLAHVSDVVDHIDHIVKIAGIDYVGIGTDFDGGGGVEGCIDASEMKNITIELLKRGYSKEEIGKIWGGNFFRVFRIVEEFRANKY